MKGIVRVNDKAIWNMVNKVELAERKKRTRLLVCDAANN